MNIGRLALRAYYICRGCGSQRTSAMTSQVVIGEKWLAIMTVGSEPAVLTDRGPGILQREHSEPGCLGFCANPPPIPSRRRPVSRHRWRSARLTRTRFEANKSAGGSVLALFRLERDRFAHERLVFPETTKICVTVADKKSCRRKFVITVVATALTQEGSARNLRLRTPSNLTAAKAGYVRR
jgi:hypothetical protein